MRTMPTSTANRNVPADVLLLAETETMSGEIVTTYYADREGYTWSVIDWKGHKPLPVYLPELWRLTGLSPNMLSGAWSSWKRNALHEAA